MYRGIIPPNILYLLILFWGIGCGFNAQAQETFTFSGTVKAHSGEPVANIQVRTDQTASGTLTDANGHFSLTHTKNHAMFTFSSIGYETVSLRAETNRPVQVSLQPKAGELNEISIVSERVQKLNTGVWNYTFLGEYVVLLKYVENIQVYGGYIYFLYRTDMNALTTYLSHIRLE